MKFLLRLVARLRKPQIGNSYAAYTGLPFMVYQGIRHNPFEKIVKESILVYTITLWDRWGNTDDLTTNPLHLVFSSATLVEQAMSIPVNPIIFPPLSVYFFFLSALQNCLCLESKTSVSVSCRRSGVRLILQWLLGSVCENPHLWHDSCTRYSVSFGSISS